MSTARLLLPFVFSAALLVLVIISVRNQADQLSAALGSAQWWLVAPAIGLYFIGVWLRSVRWGQLLPVHSVKTATLFRALVVGFTVNNLLPLRVGEVARAYLLSRWCGVPYTTTIASLVVERILDGFSLAVLLLVAVWLLPSAPAYLLAVGAIAGLGFLCGGILLAIAAWRASALTAVVAFCARVLPARLRAAVVGAAANFARALTLVHDPLRLGRLLALSLVAWCSELGLFYVLMFSVSIIGSYPKALLVGSAANFATLLPSSPGYAGTFDGALIRVAQDGLNVSAGVATAYDIVIRAALFLPVVLVGTLVLWRSHMTFNQITHAPQAAPETAYPAVSSGT